MFPFLEAPAPGSSPATVSAALASEVSSCRSLGASVTGGGAGSFDLGSSSNLSGAFSLSYPFFHYSRYQTMFAFFLFWRSSSFHLPGKANWQRVAAARKLFADVGRLQETLRNKGKVAESTAKPPRPPSG